MPRGCDYSVHVRVLSRDFVVEFDADGNCIRIKERKTKAPPVIGVYNVEYWTASSHRRGTRPNTLPNQIISAANAKLRREHVAAMATP